MSAPVFENENLTNNVYDKQLTLEIKKRIEKATGKEDNKEL